MGNDVPQQFDSLASLFGPLGGLALLLLFTGYFLEGWWRLGIGAAIIGLFLLRF